MKSLGFFLAFLHATASFADGEFHINNCLWLTGQLRRYTVETAKANGSPAILGADGLAAVIAGRAEQMTKSIDQQARSLLNLLGSEPKAPDVLWRHVAGNFDWPHYVKIVTENAAGMPVKIRKQIIAHHNDPNQIALPLLQSFLIDQRIRELRRPREMMKPHEMRRAFLGGGYVPVIYFNGSLPQERQDSVAHFLKSVSSRPIPVLTLTRLDAPLRSQELIDASTMVRQTLDWEIHPLTFNTPSLWVSGRYIDGEGFPDREALGRAIYNSLFSYPNDDLQVSISLQHFYWTAGNDSRSLYEILSYLMTHSDDPVVFRTEAHGILTDMALNLTKSLKDLESEMEILPANSAEPLTFAYRFRFRTGKTFVVQFHAGTKPS